MTPQVFGLSLVFLMICCSFGSIARAASTVVGAKIVTCNSCRLDSLPEVSQFLETVVKAYKAVEVEHITGREPEVFFFGPQGEVVSSFDLAPLSSAEIIELIARNGIHRWTPAPTYLPHEIVPTAACIAWRQTGACAPEGPREPLKDEHCTTMIMGDASGYCECADGSNIEVGCNHEVFHCDTLCLDENL